MLSKFFSLFRTAGLPPALAAGLLAAAALCAGPAAAQEPVNANGAPAQFVQTVGNNTLEVIKKDSAVRAGDPAKIRAVVNQYVLPYVDLEKTTRLAAGRYWRQANADQQKRLVEAFKGTLVRTYGGAFTRVDQNTTLSILPFRGDENANDVVVRSSLAPGNGPAVAIDYRLEKTGQGWKIYDLNVEGIWLIQNYRNQFAQQISQNGIEGLIQALNQRNNS